MTLIYVKASKNCAKFSRDVFEGVKDNYKRKKLAKSIHSTFSHNHVEFVSSFTLLSLFFCPWEILEKYFFVVQSLGYAQWYADETSNEA